MFLNLVKDNAFVQIQIAESGICQVFRQYMEYLTEKGLILDEEKSEKILKEFAREIGIF